MLAYAKSMLDVKTLGIKGSYFLRQSEEEKERMILKVLNSDQEKIVGDQLLSIDGIAISTLERVGKTTLFTVEFAVLSATLSKSFNKYLKDKSYSSKPREWVVGAPPGVCVVLGHSAEEALVGFLVNYPSFTITNFQPKKSKKGCELILKQGINVLKETLSQVREQPGEEISFNAPPQIDLYWVFDITRRRRI